MPKQLAWTLVLFSIHVGAFATKLSIFQDFPVLPEMELPTVTFRDLQRGLHSNTKNYGWAVARLALTELGALEITDVPGYAAARQGALAGVAPCLETAPGLHRQFADGTVRRSLATQTTSEGLLRPLLETGTAASRACQGDWQNDADHLRVLVRTAALHAAAVLTDEPNIAASLDKAEILEHFHLYKPPQAKSGSVNHSTTSGPQDALPLHVDAGLMLAATAGLDASERDTTHAGALLLMRADGELVRPRLRPDAILVLLGQGVAAAARSKGRGDSPSQALPRAAPHALRFLPGGASRTWYGAMMLPAGTLSSQPRRLSAIRPDVDADESLAPMVGCDGRGALNGAFPVDFADACGEGKQWCWMQCMVTPTCQDDVAPVCTRRSTGLPMSGDAMCLDCSLSCPGEEPAKGGGGTTGFCNGVGVDMFMQGFAWGGSQNSECLIFLHQSLVLDSRAKFWAALLFTFVITLLGPSGFTAAKKRLSNAIGEGPASNPSANAVIRVAIKTVDAAANSHAYIVMLISMSFSVEFFVAIIAGLTFGRGLLSDGDEQSASTLCCERTSHDFTRGATSPVNSIYLNTPTPSVRKKVELSVGGMTCTTCSGTVERTLRELAGVQDAEVSLLQERAEVVFSVAELTSAQICDAIEEIGFDATVIRESASHPQVDFRIQGAGRNLATPSPLCKMELSIGGMTCTTCSGTVERTLRGLDGIHSADVSLLRERAEVLFATKVVSSAQICEAIEDVGFDAKVLYESSRQGSSRQDSESEQAHPFPKADHTPCPTVSGHLQKDDGDVPLATLHLEGFTSRDEILSAGGAGLVDVRLISDDMNGDGQVLRLTYDPQEVGARTLLRRLKAADCRVALPVVPVMGQALHDGQTEARSAHLLAAFRSTILPSGFSIMVLFLMAVLPRPKEMRGYFSLALVFTMAILATWAAFFGQAGRMYQNSAAKALKRKCFTMDVLIAVSTSITSLYGVGLMTLAFCEILRGVDKQMGGTLNMLVHDTVHMLAMAPLLLLAFTGGKNVEHRARRHTADALRDLLAAQPTTALVQMKGDDLERPAREISGETFREVPLELLEIGDLCRITTGSRIPAEGIVVEGLGEADESLVTGESNLVPKRAGGSMSSSLSHCVGGSTLTHGDLVIRVTGVGEGTTIGRLASMIARAQGSKPSAQRLADALAARFVPFVLLLSASSAVLWLWLALSGNVAGLPDHLALQVCFALQFGLAPMMLACPCAMGLATPTAISVAVGVAGQRYHCLVKDATVIETGGVEKQRTALVLDKTGTVTEGRPSVVAAAIWVDPLMDETAGTGEDASGQSASASMHAGVVPVPECIAGSLDASASTFSCRSRRLWRAVGAAESVCPAHPVATAVASYCEAVQGTSTTDVAGATVAPGDLEHHPGQGLIARVSLDEGTTRPTQVSVGGPNMIEQLLSTHSKTPWARLQAWSQKQAGSTLVFAAIGEGSLACVLALRDPVRPEASVGVDALYLAYGGMKRCDVWLCTGDNVAAAQGAADKLGIPAERVRAGQRPQDKTQLVQELQSKGVFVVMVGDGLNDGPALVQADVGVAIGAGAQFVCDAADVVLCRSSLLDLLAFRELCKRTRRVIVRNFAWALGFNILGLPLACGVGYHWGVTIHPTIAGAAMATSSIFVVGSSLTLRDFKSSLETRGGVYSNRPRIGILHEPLLTEASVP